MHIFEPRVLGRILEHSQETHRPKLTSKNSAQNSGWKIQIALLQGYFADNLASRDPSFGEIVRSEKWQNESSPNFPNFCPEFPPEFCSEFSPNFSRSFRALFPRKQRPEKIHQKSPPFFNAKFPGNYEKIIHKIFLESRQSKRSVSEKGVVTKGVWKKKPGLLQHVLTVLVFWPWVLLLPRLPPSSQSLRLFPLASILLHGPLDICAWICCLQLPYHLCKNGTHSTSFCSTRGHTAPC